MRNLQISPCKLSLCVVRRVSHGPASEAKSANLRSQKPLMVETTAQISTLIRLANGSSQLKSQWSKLQERMDGKVAKRISPAGVEFDDDGNVIKISVEGKGLRGEMLFCAKRTNSSSFLLILVCFVLRERVVIISTCCRFSCICRISSTSEPVRVF